MALVALSSCRRSPPTPRPATSSSGAPAAALAASANAYVANARAQHFDSELRRAEGIWRDKPNLAECKTALREKPDLELCERADGALGRLVAEPTTEFARALPLLADAALSLARLSLRARHLSLSELAQKRLAASASSSGAASKTRPPAPAPSTRPLQTFEQNEGPVARLMNVAVRLERDVLRHLGAYLEYAPAVPMRRAAFQTIKALREQHPEWPSLERLLREAALLESDPELKRELRELAARGLPRPPQSADSK